MSLSGAQLEALDRALRSGFRTYGKLDMMLTYGLDRRLADITAPSGMRQVVFDLLQEAEAEGWTEDLATAALLANPGNRDLQDLHRQGIFRVGPAARRLLDDRGDAVASALVPEAAALAELPGRQELQSILNASVGFLDVVPFVVDLLERAGQVCRIEVNTPAGTGFGTGLLVGPDLVLTNHHVLSPVIEGASPGGVGFRFDYRVVDATTVEKGTEHGLDGKWLVAARPPSPFDLVDDPTGLPAGDELDFALVRLDASPGEDAVPGRPKRGWSDLGAARFPALKPGLPLAIVQHPNELPVKVVLDTEGVLAANANGTRVTYRANTYKGSSGSPCFTLGLELVALHHAGQPGYDAGRNEGIPIAAIASWLRAHGPPGLLAG